MMYLYTEQERFLLDAAALRLTINTRRARRSASRNRPESSLAHAPVRVTMFMSARRSLARPFVSYSQFT